jgi:hypothetical protein
MQSAGYIRTVVFKFGYGTRKIEVCTGQSEQVGLAELADFSAPKVDIWRPQNRLIAYEAESPISIFCLFYESLR